MKTGAKGKICQALLELADGKSAQDVTVSELIARAGINRSTFYYHFTGTHEALEYMMDDFCAQYLSALMIPRGEVAKSISKSSQDALEKGVCGFSPCSNAGPSGISVRRKRILSTFLTHFTTRRYRFRAEELSPVSRVGDRRWYSVMITQCPDAASRPRS